MQEVYTARAEELGKWITQDQQKVLDLTQQLNQPDLSELIREDLNKQLAGVLTRLRHHQGSLAKMNEDRDSKLWF